MSDTLFHNMTLISHDPLNGFGGVGEGMASLIAASYSAMQFLFMPVWGRISDRIGRRPVLLFGAAADVVDGDAASPFFFLGGRLRFAGAGPLTAAFCPALGLTMASWAAW